METVPTKFVARQYIDRLRSARLGATEDAGAGVNSFSSS